MNAAIECSCGNVIIYDSLLMAIIVCPNCKRRWIQQPELFGDDGTPAKRLPYLVAGKQDELWNDEFVQEVMASIQAGVDSINAWSRGLGRTDVAGYPRSVTFYSGDGPPVTVPFTVQVQN